MLNDIYEFIMSDLRNSCRDLFKTGNIPSMNAVRFNEKRGISNADLPELQMGLVNITGPLTASSSHAKIVLVYDIRIASGQLNQRLINDLLWWLITRVQYLSMNRGIFVYQDVRPITAINFSDASVGLSNVEATRNVEGFSSLAKIRVDLHVPNSLIIPVACDNV